jgi:hypothetical protein
MLCRNNFSRWHHLIVLHSSTSRIQRGMRKRPSAKMMHEQIPTNRQREASLLSFAAKDVRIEQAQVAPLGQPGPILSSTARFTSKQKPPRACY